MKKIVTLDSIMVSFISAMGYGFGFTVPNAYKINPIICVLICMALGTIMNKIATMVIFNSYVQKNNARRYIVFGCFALFFGLGYFFLAKFFAYSLWNDVGTDLTFSVVIPIVFFIISIVISAVKQKKLLEKYGTGDSGFILDDDIESQWKDDMGVNSEVINYSGKNPAVKTCGGTYIGKIDKDCVCFLGIPYAKAPIGENRWKAPIPVEQSDRVFESYYFGNTEIQPESAHNILNRFKQDEDCLNLNVWTKTFDPTAKKPVFVFVHGGDGRYGGSAAPIYFLKNLAGNLSDSICVSINYRFGVFGVVGFDSSDFADADDYNDSTALSLLDQIEALKWIKANIAAFGGDPENITVAGDNSGGSCILLLASMKETKGLFKRAMIMCASTSDTIRGGERTAMVGKALFKEFNADSVKKLQSVSSDQLKDFSKKYYDILELPPRDGKNVSSDVDKLFLDGVASDVEFVFGIAADNMSGWMAMLAGDYSVDDITNTYYTLLSDIVGEIKSKEVDCLLKKYMESGLNEMEAKRILLADFQYKSSILHDCRTLAKGGSKVKVFYWDVKGNIEKFTANSVSMVTTIFGNSKMAEQLGYINDNSITEIMQAFIDKLIHGDELELYNNELQGVRDIKWNDFSSLSNNVLHIQKDGIRMSQNAFSENVLELERIVLNDGNI